MKRRILEYVNSLDEPSSTNDMDLGALFGEESGDKSETNGDSKPSNKEESKDEDGFTLGDWKDYAIDALRWKGKGGGKGNQGGKGGKGPATGCFVCGGAHYQRDCKQPPGTGGGKGKGSSEGMLHMWRPSLSLQLSA